MPFVQPVSADRMGPSARFALLKHLPTDFPTTIFLPIADQVLFPSD